MSSNLDAIRAAFNAWGQYLDARDASERTNATYHRRELAALAMRLFGVNLFAAERNPQANTTLRSLTDASESNWSEWYSARELRPMEWAN